jgi:hypothetical protein
VSETIELKNTENSNNSRFDGTQEKFFDPTGLTFRPRFAIP